MWSPFVGGHSLPPAPGQAAFPAGPEPSPLPSSPPAALPEYATAPHPNDVAAPLVDLRNTVTMPVLPLPAPPPGMPSSGAAPAPTSGLGATVISENGHTLGLALLLVGVGGAIGVKYGGLFGGSAGAVYGGSAVNAIRAARAVMQGTPEADREALVSASYAVVGIGFATWLVWKTGDRKAAR
jgi:hypothetical protein